MENKNTLQPILDGIQTLSKGVVTIFYCEASLVDAAECDRSDPDVDADFVWKLDIRLEFEMHIM